MHPKASPRISVRIITYNHAPFITKAVESVLAQDVDEALEIIVADDASTDGTAEVVRSLAERHPGVVKPMLRSKNVGWIVSGHEAYLACSGKYTAVLDGDDFWISTDKLRKQVEFLESDPNNTMCFHDVVTVNSRGEVISSDSPTEVPPFPSLKDLLDECIISSGSVMFRSDVIRPWPAAYESVPFRDWPLQVICARQGRIGYLPGLQAAHRVHEGGIWTAGGSQRAGVRLRRLSWRIQFYRATAKYLGHEHRAAVYAGIRTHLLRRLKRLWDISSPGSRDSRPGSVR